MLPPTMPLETKYSMVKILWDKYGPSTNKILMAGEGATAQQIHIKASEYLLKTIEDWEVNPNLKKIARYYFFNLVLNSSNAFSQNFVLLC